MDDLAVELADEGHAALYFVLELGMNISSSKDTLVMEKQPCVDEGRGRLEH